MVHSGRCWTTFRGEWHGKHCAGPGLPVINYPLFTVLSVFYACLTIMAMLMPLCFGAVKHRLACRSTAGTRGLGRLLSRFSQTGQYVAVLQRCTAGSVQAHAGTPLQIGIGPSILTRLATTYGSIAQRPHHGSQAGITAGHVLANGGLGVLWHVGRPPGIPQDAQDHGVPRTCASAGHGRSGTSPPVVPLHPWVPLHESPVGHNGPIRHIRD